MMSLTESVDVPLGLEAASGDFETDPDALKLAQEVKRAGLIGQNVLDHLTSLNTQVPNSMMLTYLMVQLRKSVSGDDQLFLKMIKILVAFQSTPANSANDILLNTDHIADLAELLVNYASEWRSIGTALKFKPHDLNNIEACQSPKDRILKLIEYWILKKHEYTLPPTVNNLGSALKSRLVGLGVVADELRTIIARSQHLSAHNQALPYFVVCISIIENKIVSTNYSRNFRLQAEEKGSVLLEVRVEAPKNQRSSFQYQWLCNGIELQEGQKHTGVTTQVLCISNADLDMDGSKYSCQIFTKKGLATVSRYGDYEDYDDDYQYYDDDYDAYDDDYDAYDDDYEYYDDYDRDIYDDDYNHDIYDDDDYNHGDCPICGCFHDRSSNHYCPICDCSHDCGRKHRGPIRSFNFETKPVTLSVSCPLDQYASSLTSMYLAQPEVPKDTWPPISSSKHINLALIKQGTPVNYSAEYVHVTIRGDMDDILECKQEVEYAQVLQSVKSKYVLFIEGRPGSGKSTFVHKITRDWATAPNGALRLVLLVSLRVLNDFNKPSLDILDILNLFNDLKVPKELLEKRNGKGVCFIFDGFDEFSPSDKNNSLVHRIINKKYLSQSSVIVASRPAAIAGLREMADKVIEVLGFPNQQIFEYFDSYRFSASYKSKDLKAYLKGHPNVLHMCYLPIHTAMVAYLFEVTGKVPRTETEIYRHFTHLTIVRSLTKNAAVGVEDIDVHNLSLEVQKLFKQICKVALEKTIANKQVLHQDEVVSYFQGSKDVDVSLGLITVDRTAGLYDLKNIYTFLHLTFQEYLAAYHISTLSSEDQYKLIKLHGDKKYMLMVWKFLCGLIKFDIVNDDKFTTLARRCFGNTLFLVQSAYESQDPIVCGLLLKLVQATFKFKKQQNLTTSDFTALGYVMANATAPISLSLQECNVNSETIGAMLSERDGKKFLIHTLRCCSYHLDGDTLQKLLRVIRSVNFLKIHSRKASTISRNCCNFCTDLTALSFNNVLLGPDNLQTILINCTELKKLKLLSSVRSDDLGILNYLEINCKKLELLDISYNRLAEGTKLFAPGLAQFKELKTVIICNNSITPEGVEVLLGSLKACKLKVCSNEIFEGNYANLGSLKVCENLQELRLFEELTLDSGSFLVSSSRNWQTLHSLELNGCINDTTVRYISYALPFLTSNLTVLRVVGTSSCTLSKHGATELARNLDMCTKLAEFLIRHCEIGDEGAQALAGALKHCKKISTLDMSYSLIRNNGTASIFSTIAYMTQLTALNLSGNILGSEGVDAISSLMHCNSLCTLNLNGNDIGKQGAITISSCLKHWPNLQALGVCGNIISDSRHMYKIYRSSNVGGEGAVVLAENLSRYCSKLEVLNLSCNDIDGHKATSLVQSLAKCTNLAQLYLEENELSEGDGSIEELQSWQHLSHLSY